MTRVLSALVLLPIVVGAVWFLPPLATLGLALVAAALAFLEYAAIAAALDTRIPRIVSGAAVLPIVYIGLPLGALAAVRALGGREALLLLMATIVISDSAQYYTGRAFGRRALAPAISPKKTVEGAVGGLLIGTLAFIAGTRLIFPGASLLLTVLAGASVAALGIVGDLFESLLKRSAGVKDSGSIIPGHGGVLDRIDSWLFAAPVYYVFIRYMQV